MQEGNQTKEIIESLKEDLEKSVVYLKGEYAVIRAGRANPHILDKILVDYYGTPTPLSQMANMSVQEARLLVVSLYDISQVRSVVKAISEADLGVNISDDGRVIRLAFPILTEERRKEIVKQCGKEVEAAKVGIRNIRRDGIEKLKKSIKEGLSEDNEKDAEADLQKIHDNYMKKVDELLAKKNKELMTV